MFMILITQSLYCCLYCDELEGITHFLYCSVGPVSSRWTSCLHLDAFENTNFNVVYPTQKKSWYNG